VAWKLAYSGRAEPCGFKSWLEGLASFHASTMLNTWVVYPLTLPFCGHPLPLRGGEGTGEGDVQGAGKDAFFEPVQENPHNAPVLICFAVEDEARHFRKLTRSRPCQILITGIGPRNAKQSLLNALKDETPALVLSSGFAGGLNPELRTGEVGFDAPGDSNLAPALQSACARPVRFHSCDRIASTVAEKLALWRSTGADAVEMESGPLREICAQRNIPSATIRVISDAADEDLPLDFNRLMTSDQKLDYFKLTWALAKSPGKVAALWAFRQRIDRCAAKLAAVLGEVLAAMG